jgi:hypothetical protein
VWTAWFLGNGEDEPQGVDYLPLFGGGKVADSFAQTSGVDRTRLLDQDAGGS